MSYTRYALIGAIELRYLRAFIIYSRVPKSSMHYMTWYYNYFMGPTLRWYWGGGFDYWWRVASHKCKGTLSPCPPTEFFTLHANYHFRETSMKRYRAFTIHILMIFKFIAMRGPRYMLFGAPPPNSASLPQDRQCIWYFTKLCDIRCLHCRGAKLLRGYRC